MPKNRTVESQMNTRGVTTGTADNDIIVLYRQFFNSWFSRLVVQKMMRWLISRINGWVLLVSLLIALGLLVLFAVLVVMLPVPARQPSQTSAALTVISAPTPTPTQPPVIETPTPTAPPNIEGISVGSYVQIADTDGQGLRLRSGPGTSNPPRFLGMDAEVFQVLDGPEVSDGFTWWFLEAPYDPARSGWAASQFLRVVLPTQTP